MGIFSLRCDGRSLSAAMLLTSLIGCDERGVHPVEPADLPPLADAVTPELAASLSPSGEFIFPPRPGVVNLGEISDDRARDLARAYVHSFGNFFLEQLEAERGSAIELTEIEIGPRVYYASSPYTVPDGTPLPTAKAYGPYYLMHGLLGGQPALTLAVSTLSADIGIGPDGTVEYPRISGNEFRMRAVPAGAVFPYPMTPEDAVRITAALSGARAADLPSLVLPGVIRRGTSTAVVPPHLAYWRIRLDRAVQIQAVGDSGYREVSELFVDTEGELWVPDPGSPPPPTVFYIRNHEPREFGTLTLGIRDGMVTDYVRVQSIAGRAQ